jgi:hypothetical protein
MRLRTTFISSCISLCLLAPAARADDAHKELGPLPKSSSFALLPAMAAAGGGADPSEAVKAISEKLRARGYKVLSPQQVKSKLASHTPDGCSNPATCDPALALATLRTDAAVSTAVWQRPHAPMQVVVHVRRAHSYGQAEVNVNGKRASDLRVAAAAALSQALEDSEHTHELAVIIESTPSNASVHVDQTLSGRTPARLALLPGSHLISVEAPGYVTRAQYLDLSESSPKETKLSLQLSAASTAQAAAAPEPVEEADEAPAPEAQPHVQLNSAQMVPEGPFPVDSSPSQASPLNYVFASVLYGIALPLLANAIYAAATNGDCVGGVDARGACAERVKLGPIFAVSAGLGGAALLGGTAFLVFQPITEGSKGAAGAMLSMRSTF